MKVLSIAVILLLSGINFLGINSGLPSREKAISLFGSTENWHKNIIQMVRQREEYYTQIANLKKSKNLEDDLKNIYDYSRKILPGTEMSADYKLWQARGYLLGPLNSDEQRTLVAVGNMNPKKFDFNPNDFTYGGLYFIFVGVAFLAGKISTILSLSPQVDYYLAHPEEVARMYILARLISFLAVVLLLVLLYCFARKYWSKGTALLAVIFLGLNPLININSHLAKPHTLAALMSFISFVYFWKIFTNCHQQRDYFLAGIFSGLTAALAYPYAFNGLALIALGTITLDTQRRKSLAITLLAFVFAFGLFNFYLPFSWREFVNQKRGLEILFNYGVVGLPPREFWGTFFRTNLVWFLLPLLFLGSKDIVPAQGRTLLLLYPVVVLLSDILYFHHPNIFISQQPIVAIILARGFLVVWKKKIFLWRTALGAAIAILFLNSFAQSFLQLKPKNLSESALWINQHIPAKKRLGVFSPYLSPGTFPPIDFFRYHLIYFRPEPERPESRLGKIPADYLIAIGNEYMPTPDFSLCQEFRQPVIANYLLGYGLFSGEFIPVKIYSKNENLIDQSSNKTGH